MAVNEKWIQVLLVEDHLGEADLVKEWLANAATHAFAVTHVCTAYTAVRHLNDGSYDVVLLDLSLPDSYGIETILAIREVNPHIPIVVMTGIRHTRLADQARQWGVEDFLHKDDLDENLITWTLQKLVHRSGRPNPMARNTGISM